MKAIHMKSGVKDPRDPLSPYTANRRYCVHLGNGNTVQFLSRRSAVACQAEVDRWISGQLVAANFALAEAFAAYRAGWLLMDRCRVPKIEAKAAELILEAWRSLDMAVLKSTGPNGWHFAWTFLASAIAAVRDLVAMLQELHGTRNNPVERYRMDLLGQRLNDQLKAMADYGNAWPGGEVVRLRG